MGCHICVREKFEVNNCYFTPLLFEVFVYIWLYQNIYDFSVPHVVTMKVLFPDFPFKVSLKKSLLTESVLYITLKYLINAKDLRETRHKGNIM